MDLDLAFIKAILAQENAFNVARQESISAEMLEGEGQTAWKFLSDHYVAHGELPSEDLVFAKLGLALPDVVDGVKTLVSEIKGRAVYEKVKALHEELTVIIEDRHARINETVPVITEFLNELHRSSITGQKIGNLLALGPEVMAFYDRMKAGERGIQTPWIAMNEATLGWWPGDFVVFAARMGVGKCVSGETEIPDPKTGVYRKIRDVVRDAGMVYTRDSYGEYRNVMPDGHWYTGRKRCIRIVTKSGLSIDTTPEHPYSVLGGWNAASNLKIGDFVETVKFMPTPEMAIDDIDDSEVLLLSALLAEGGLTTNPPKFSNMDPEILKIVESASNRLGCDFRKHNGMNESTWSISSDTWNKNEVREFLQQWNVGYEKSTDKVIPDRVFSLSNRLLSKFIGMFFSCDGSIEAENRISIGLASYTMIMQIKRLMLRFGITGRVRYKPVTRRRDGKVFNLWEYLVHSTCIGLFKSSIPLYGVKATLLATMRVGENPNVDNVPVTAWLKEKLLSMVDDGKAKGIRISDVGKELGWTSWFSTRNLFQYPTISKRLLQAVGKVYGQEEFMNSICLPHWDEIVDIVNVGECDVYDLTVNGPHCFVANDIVAHNTFCMLHLARQAWADGKKVLFVGTEMNRLNLAMRFFAIHFQIPYREFRRGEVGYPREDEIRKAIQLISGDTGIYVVGDDFDADINVIISAIEQTRPDIVFVDGLYLVRNKGHDRHTRVSNTADDLKRTAKRIGVPIITSTQFNREVSTNSRSEVSAENIGISDVIGWNADVMYGLFQKEDMKEDKEMGFRPMKIREGEAKDFYTRWDFEKMDFSQSGTEEDAGKKFVDDFDGVDGIKAEDTDGDPLF